MAADTLAKTPRSAFHRECQNQHSHNTVDALRRRFNDFTPRPIDPDLRRDLQHGWMLPALLHLDDCLWGRWNYWARCHEADGHLPKEPIPRIEFLTVPHPATRRMLEISLDCIPQHGSWRTWGGWTYFDYLLAWLLFGLGHKGQCELPTEPAGCTGASNRLFQIFALDALLLWPHDYFGCLLTENAFGRSQGFYPTPHNVCEFMTQILCDEERDMRTETVCDPCVGTGRMLLHASNHSLRLYGMDMSETVCKATLVNGYLWALWLVRPIPWLDRELAALEHMVHDGDSVSNPVAQELSDFMAATAPTHAQAYLRDSEHDPDVQPIVAPLLKRRKRHSVDPTQGTLF
jgi:hypothetical protein